MRFTGNCRVSSPPGSVAEAQILLTDRVQHLSSQQRGARNLEYPAMGTYRGYVTRSCPLGGA